jgi:hypothetical protein
MSQSIASRLALSVAALAVVVGCNNDKLFPTPASKPAPTAAVAAVGLEYTDPTGSGWRLVRDPNSTVTRLVLNLVGPTGQKGRGVGFNLRSDGTVKFSRFDNGSYINDLGVFQLTNKAGAVSALDGFTPVANDIGTIVGGVKEGGHMLTVGAFQKDRRWPAVDLGQPLYQVAIVFDPSQTLASGTTIPLTFVRARSIPENIGDDPGNPNANPATWAFQYQIDEVKVAVGTLVAL